MKKVILSMILITSLLIGAASAMSLTASALEGEPFALTTYAVTLEYDADLGTLTPSAGSAEAGSTVTLTATPKAGYSLGVLTVSDGTNEIETTSGENGTYTFTMPAASVKVTARFGIPIGELYYFNDDENGTTFIFGNGEISSLSSLAPLMNSKVVVEDGITSVDNYAFRGCSSVEAVTFNGDIERIGHYAFMYCASLESVTFNGNVDSIGNNVFESWYTIYYYGTTAPTGSLGSTAPQIFVSEDYAEDEFAGASVSKTLPGSALADISTDAVIDIEGATYNGTKQEPKVSITVGGTALVKGVDFTVDHPSSYDFTDAGIYGLLVEGIGDYKGSVKISYIIKKATLKASDFTLTPPSDLTYNGEEKSVTVSANDGIAGIGDITVNYYDAGDNQFMGAPSNSGTYTVKIDVAEGTNYNAASNLVIGSFTVEEVDADVLMQKVIELTNKVKALEDNGATDAELTAAKAELTEAYGAAVKKVADDLAKAEADLKKAIDDNEADIEDKVAKLDAAYKAADALINSEIAKLQSEDTAIKNSIADLDEAYKAADAALDSAIKKVASDLEKAQADLKKAIDDNEADIEDKVAKLDAAYKAADALINSEIAKLQSEDTAIKNSIADLDEAYKAADAALDSAIKKVASDLSKAQADLKKAIDDNEADIEDKVAKLDAAYKAADALINSEIAKLKSEDTAIKNSIADLDEAYKAADAALDAAIKKVASDLSKAREELEKAIKDGDNALSDRITYVSISLDAAKTALEKADADNKAELIATIEEAEATLNTAIEAVKKALDDAKAELSKAIADGDGELDVKIDKLNTALEIAKTALESADAANRETLSAKIDNADAVLKAAIDDLSSDLKKVKSDLSGLRTELEEKDSSLQTFIIIVCVISGISLCGIGVLTVWIILDKKKRI